jgi:hypothetical protein
VITTADVARVARQYDLPPVVAYGLAADVALGARIRAERSRLKPRKARSELLTHILEREEQK